VTPLVAAHGPGAEDEPGPSSTTAFTVGRRAFLAAASGLGLVALFPPARLVGLSEVAIGAGRAGRFLSAHELDTLRAVTARLIPGPPDDADPGAVEAGCAEAIDLLLGAFRVRRPPIHAGGPFSGRAGGHHDDFAEFVPLDSLAELGWRIRLEGSRGRSEREFAGPVRGLQEVFRSGLAHLDTQARAAHGVDFVAASGAAQDALLSDQSDSALADFVGMSLDQTLSAMYGPPEYGGNRRLVGWRPLGWRGDTQPRGFTAREVSTPGPGPLLDRAQADTFMRQFPALAGNPAPDPPQRAPQ
jgi:hypothetical protein